MKSTNRIDECFDQLRKTGRKAFIAYISAGDPDLKMTEKLACSFEKCGVDILELGVPFSDPLADGVVNQLAAARGLQSKTTLDGVLKMVARLRKSGVRVPVVLYIYFNLVHQYGLKKFVKAAKESGVDGVLNLDLPPEEAGEFTMILEKANIHPIYLVAPTTPPERIKRIGREARGFIYYVSREGVTGMRKKMVQGLDDRISLIRENSCVPVVVGFGISTPQQVREAARSADGCVVGSAIVNRIALMGKKPKMVSHVSRFVKQLSKPLS